MRAFLWTDTTSAPVNDPIDLMRYGEKISSACKELTRYSNVLHQYIIYYLQAPYI